MHALQAAVNPPKERSTVPPDRLQCRTKPECSTVPSQSAVQYQARVQCINQNRVQYKSGNVETYPLAEVFRVQNACCVYVGIYYLISPLRPNGAPSTRASILGPREHEAKRTAVVRDRSGAWPKRGAAATGRGRSGARPQRDAAATGSNGSGVKMQLGATPAGRSGSGAEI